jgi:DNA polymerase-3 subunit epsilon
LAEVYVELIGARQAQLGLAEGGNRHADGTEGVIIIRERPEPLASRLSEADIAAHNEFVIGLGESALWRDYRPNAG